MITQHTVRFFRSVEEPSTHKAACTCGWSMNGDLAELQARAATHDIDGVEFNPEPSPKGFVSGLPPAAWRK